MILKMYDNNLCEMAIINPKACKHLTIQVEVEQRDEGPIPHLHVYHNKERNPMNCSYVRLDDCSYSHHHKTGKPLPDKLKRQFIELMNAPCPNYVMYDNEDNMYPVTGYQAAVLIWADTYRNGDLSCFKLDDNGLIVQMDYSSL